MQLLAVRVFRDSLKQHAFWFSQREFGRYGNHVSGGTFAYSNSIFFQEHKCSHHNIYNNFTETNLKNVGLLGDCTVMAR